MNQILKLSVLISIIFASGCKSDKHMNTSLKAPSAEKQAKSLTIHNSTRIDNYFWMRLTSYVGYVIKPIANYWQFTMHNINWCY